MFKTFFLAEIQSAFKRPMIYIMFFLMALLTFGITVSEDVNIGGSANIYKNSPYTITLYTTYLSIFGLLIAAAFFNNAALKEYKNNFNEILFSTPLNKTSYFFGRFSAALFLSTVPLLGVFLGVIIGSVLAPLLGWESADRYGSIQIFTFISNYIIFILPNMFFAGALIYALANAFKSTVISFVGGFIVIVAYLISGSLLSDIDNETLGAMFDTFGLRSYSIASKYYTPLEKNTLNPSFTGILLWNRIVWITIGLSILMWSYFTFSFKTKNKKVTNKKTKEITAVQTFTLPKLNPTYNFASSFLQFKSFFKLNFLSIVKSITFKILFLFSIILVLSSLLQGYDYYGLQSYPVTYKILDTISSNVLFLTIIIVFFSGELFWRDRESKINEVIDTTPHNSILSVLAKVLSLIVSCLLICLLFIVTGILYQLAKGFTQIELSTYLLDIFYNLLPIIIIYSSISITIQVLINNKYIAYFVSVLVLIGIGTILLIFDIESNMLLIGGKPILQFSDMNNFGPGVKGALWFNLYWVLFSLICLFISAALWARGTVFNLKERIKKANKQVSKTYKLAATLVVISFISVAGYAYYNTQVLNEYATSDEIEELQVSYELKYKKFENIPLPKIHSVKNKIDIYPSKRDLYVNSKMLLVNENEVPVNEIHYAINTDAIKTDINIPSATLTLNDTILGYRIYTLSKPLKPNDSLYINIETALISKGFENNTPNIQIIKNGTFVDNGMFLPQLGYQSNYEITDLNKRKKHDLAPKNRMPKLQKECTEGCTGNYLSQGRADYIDIENTVSTSADQLAIAPGSLVKEWKENDRNYFTYKVDHPSQNFYSIISANYQVKKRQWNGIDLEVYYDAKHNVNVETMLDAIQKSLTYYTENFGPYYHKQCRIIEFPRYRNFAQAFPGTMPYSESFGFITNLENENDNNIVDAVVAHEMAHQWWAHQVVGANMQGGTMLSESFSEYSSLMVMKKTSKTPMKMREFLKYNHNSYLRGRSSEVEKELPLIKNESQNYIHYSKGSVVLYALQDYIGEKKVNTALKNFLEAYRYKKPPYPTSLDFMEYLKPQIPDSLNYVINDWFENITFYDNRIKEASYSKLPNGKYEINLEILSKKIVSDSIGNEKEVTTNDWIDLGAFGDTDEENLIFEKRVKIDKPEMTFKFEIDTIPAKLAIDPRHLLIDKVYKDNIKTVEEL